MTKQKNDIIKKAAELLEGRRRGGLSTLRKYGPEHFSEMGKTTLRRHGKKHYSDAGKKGAHSRWYIRNGIGWREANGKK
jgi:hypothetical protein